MVIPAPRTQPNRARRSAGYYEQQGRAITGSVRELKPVHGAEWPSGGDEVRREIPLAQRDQRKN
jgi:hypothetical protein